MKFLIKLTTFIFLIFAFPEIPEAVEPSDYNTEDVIAHVNEMYGKVHSARGRITRIIEAGDNNTKRYIGRFAIRKPDRLLVEFTGDVRQFMGYDGKTFRIYFPDENRGFYTETGKLSSLERFVLGPGPFFGNILQIMSDGFKLEVADFFEGNLILKASPEQPLYLNLVLLGISPDTWTIRAVEHFDRENNLVSQTRFLSFKSLGDSLFFPTTVETSTVVKDNVMLETTLLTRVQLNIPLEDDVFRIPDNDETVWKEQPFGKTP